MKKINFKTKNKTIWKWVLYNLFIIIFCISLIINITYLPKYFQLKNHKESYTTVTIEGKNNLENEKLFAFTYETNFLTLGDLMANYNTTYHTTETGMGRTLDSVTFFYYPDQKIETWKGSPIGSTNKKYWMIQQNGKNTPVGIDLLYLKNNETFQLTYIQD